MHKHFTAFDADIRDLQIRVTSSELSLLPAVSQQMKGSKKQDWCEKQLSKPRKLDLKKVVLVVKCECPYFERILAMLSQAWRNMFATNFANSFFILDFLLCFCSPNMK